MRAWILFTTSLALWAQAPLAVPAGLSDPLAWDVDGTQFVARRGMDLVVYNVRTQAARTLVNTEEIDKQARERMGDASGPYAWENRHVSQADVQWTGNRVLYVTGGELYLIWVASGDVVRVGDVSGARDAKASPDGLRIAYRRGWDLYTVSTAVPFRVKQITKGGSDVLRNGGLDWVYPEELELGTAFWWSPDSKSIAYLQFDISGEPVYMHTDVRHERIIEEPQHYPQAGDPNPAVRLGVVSADGGGTKWFDVGDTVSKYLVARVTWAPDSQKLYVVRPNRVQNQAQLLAYDVGSRKATVVLEESDPFWLNAFEEPRFFQVNVIGLYLKKGTDVTHVYQGTTQFLWLSERDGFRHIYVYSPEGKLVRQLTSGPWEVTSIEGVDEATGVVYYTSREASPLEHQLYAIGIDGTGKRQLTAGAGTHSIHMGPKPRFFLDAYSSVTSPPRVTLHDGDGKELAVYRAAAPVDNALPVELGSFQGADGTTFYTRMIKPAGFDASKKYPAIVQVYGGPGAQGILNAWYGSEVPQAWFGSAFDQAAARAGFVVWQVDNRGSTGRGHAFETPVYHKLGVLELADQVEGVRHLVSLGFVDPARVGIRGWSYGGFMTLNAMLNAPDVFHAGAAGAPVTDWRLYDTIYTERYMGLPKDNAEGYKATALPQKAAQLQGSLLIMHNYEDDNVLFQHTAQMLAALEGAGKRFDLALYTQKTHAVSGAERQDAIARMLTFFERALQ